MKTIKTILASLSLSFALAGAAFAVSLEETLQSILLKKKTKKKNKNSFK